MAHADLPHALDLAWVADFDGRHPGARPPRRRHQRAERGARLPGFGFAYGAGSFARHVAEAERLGLALRIERERRLGWDVDLPADLATPDWLAS